MLQYQQTNLTQHRMQSHSHLSPALNMYVNAKHGGIQGLGTFCPTSMLVNVDLPAFGTPITATCGRTQHTCCLFCTKA